MSLARFVNEDKTIIDYIEETDEEGIEYKIIDFDTLVFSAFSHLKCMNCGMFRRNYHCLAVPTWRRAKEILSKYTKFILVFSRADNRERIAGLQRSNADRIKEGRRTMNDWLVKRNACNANQVKLYSKIKRVLIGLNHAFPNEKMKIFGAGGGCRSCRVCNYILPHKTGEKRKPCCHPKESFNAPESWGIDVYATLKKAEIEFTVIPEYDLIDVGLVVVKEK